MLPSIRLVLAAIFATVVLMMGGFWLISTFQIAKTSAGVPPRGAPPFDPALADGSKRKQIYALIGMRRVNEISPLTVDSPSTNTRVTTAARFDDEETVVETAVNNVGAAGVTKLASPSRSDDTDQPSSLASRPGSTPTAAPVVALTEDPATVRPRINIDAAITPTASADGGPVGEAIAAEAPGGTSTAHDATVSAIPSTKTRDALVAADPPTGGDTAGKSNPSRIAPEIAAADPPSIAAETTLAPSSSRTAAEGIVPSTADEKRVAPNPSSATALEETAIPAPHHEPKVAAPKAKRTPNAAKPHAQAKKAKAHQVATSQARTKTAAHLRTRRFRHATQSTAQPQNPANPFGNFFGSQ